MTARKHKSPSQFDMFTRCGEAYRRRYIEGEIIPPGIAMVKGTALHRGAQANFSQKIESRRDLPASEIVEQAVASFELSTHDCLSLSDDEISMGAGKAVGQAKDDVAEMALEHAHSQAPDYQPVYVEKRVDLAMPAEVGPLVGIIDLVDDRDRVTDFKTAKRAKKQADLDTSVQLTVYAAAMKALTGREATEVRLDTLVATKGRVRRQLLSGQRGPADFIALAARINAIQRAIDAGAFVPAAPGSWNCSDRWCGYWRTCPFVNSERREKAAVAQQQGDDDGGDNWIG